MNPVPVKEMRLEKIGCETMTNWKTILKSPHSPKGFFNIYNVAPIVRETISEWSTSKPSGSIYHLWQIRNEIGDLLLPKLRDESKKAGLRTQNETIYVQKHFDLKEAQNSKFDKTIYNSLWGTKEWSIKGTTAKASIYEKL